MGYINTAESPLKSPGRLFREIRSDIRSTYPQARRFFLQHIASQYRHSSLGILWAFVPTIVIALAVTMGNKTKIFQADASEGIPMQVFAISGVIMMQVFLESMNPQRILFTQYKNILQRQRLPIESFVLSQLAEASFHFLVKLPILLIVLLVFNTPPVITAPLALLGFAAIILFGAGIGLWLAPFSGLNTDLDKLMAFLPWVLFMAAPVFFYTPDQGILRIVHLCNPLTYLFESTRYLLYGDAAVYPLRTLAVTGSAIMFFLSGWAFCRIATPHVTERMLT